MTLDPAWIALIGTLCGGLGLKLLEHWLGKSKVKLEESTKMREELRDDITKREDEIKTLEAEVDKWRRDYYDLRDKYSTLNTEYLIALEKIKHQAITSISNVPPEPIDPE